MQSRKNLSGGYVGLLMLLISVAIIAFVIVRTDLFDGKKGGESVLEQGTDAINQAKEAKDLIEQNSRQSVE